MKLPVDNSARLRQIRMAALAMLPFLALPALARVPVHPGGHDGRSARLARELSGQAATRQGLLLHLVTNEGDLHITTHDSNTVDCHVRLEVDSDNRDARRLLKNFSLATRTTPEGVLIVGRAPNPRWGQRLLVTFEVQVPRNYNLDISTQGGNIRVGNMNGRVDVATNGGSITTGGIHGPARLTTDGGNVSVKGVSGDLVVQTGGGNITAGPVGGTAILRTGGGHIRVASIGGIGRLETGGGNISLEKSGSGLVATTGGGQIEVGEASGLIRARTGGGGIRIVRTAGPAQLSTSAGNVYLMQIASAVRASTGSGGITAWFAPGAKLNGPCRLQAGQGDIVVYLPKLLPVTVDAQVDYGGDHRVFVDPAFPLKVTYGQAEEGSNAVRAVGTLNGGGAQLILRTVSGNIRLMVNDAAREKQQMDLLKQRMEELRRQLQMDLRKMAVPQPPDGH